MKPIYYATNKSPCQNCEERHLHCHSECEKYLIFRRKQDERAKESKKRIEVYRLLNGHEHDRKMLYKQDRVKSPHDCLVAKKRRQPN